jgi:penicillin-binding protein 1A
LITTEDRNFYSHSGIDLKGILRAAIRDIQARAFVEGASTITQQLAKTLFLTPRKSLVRKIKEALLAFQLERRYTKDELLEFYLNQVYFGSGAYGVEAAAQLFFGKPVRDLNLAECALMAALPKAPSRFSPLIDPDLARRRRDIVLKQMLRAGIITRNDYQAALAEPVVPDRQNNASLKAPYFVDFVRKDLEEAVGANLLYKGGLTVFTTLSFELQQAAEKAVKNGLTALEQRMLNRGVRLPYPQAALIALDNQTGYIAAMVGGRDYYASQYNRATVARRQPGSAFKPIVYALAIESGFAQNNLLLDAPVAFKGALDGKDWRPENFSKSYQGEMTLRKALTFSKNIPAVRLTEMLGPSAVVRFANMLGITSPLQPNLSLPLGTSEVTLIELTAAYATFANKGEWIKPFGVTEIQDRQGRIVWQVKPLKKQVVSQAGAAIMTNILEGVIKEGTGRKARSLRPPLAGKTGTTDSYNDALFIGFSPSLTLGVWVGQDMQETLGNMETGARAALPIWIEFMQTAISQRPYHYFDIPDDVVKVWMDPDSGRRVAADAPRAVEALFKKGTEPQ